MIANIRKIVAEFIGTFALIFIGAGAGALAGFEAGGGLVGVALAHGLVVLVFAAAYGPISGGHLNPAVTVGLWLGKQIDSITAVLYIVAQLLGGIVAGLMLSFVLAGTTDSVGETLLASGVSPAQGFVLEMILTFFLVNSIYNTAVAGRGGNAAPVAIGLTLTFAILMGGPLTGGSLNPARSLGPAVASGNYSDIWLYMAGPVVGGILAAALYLFVLNPRNET